MLWKRERLNNHNKKPVWLRSRLSKWRQAVLITFRQRAAAENTNSMRLKLTLRGEVTVLFLSSTDADVWSTVAAGPEVEMEAELLSLLTLPLVSTTAGLSLSFFLLSVLTMGWSYGPGLAQSCKDRHFSVVLYISLFSFGTDRNLFPLFVQFFTVKSSDLTEVKNQTKNVTENEFIQSGQNEQGLHKLLTRRMGVSWSSKPSWWTNLPAGHSWWGYHGSQCAVVRIVWEQGWGGTWPWTGGTGGRGGGWRGSREEGEGSAWTRPQTPPVAMEIWGSGRTVVVITIG